ncbi:MAG: hypothetical protein KBB01_07335, partial [Candidatus Omnitrophica bacterium]|nr:hypothetical protein [Candidatus Omnitrophota bacterium]
DFLFHILIIPFLYLSQDLVLAGKYAFIFYNILFVIIYLAILKKYLPSFLAGLLLLPLLTCLVFSAYFMYLRPAILANIFTILGIYWLINKRWIKLFVIALLYPLVHISFLTLLVFALIAEIIRYVVVKEFFLRNIYAVIIATFVGCFLHPNYPNNYLSVHLNAILVPFYTLKSIGLDFGGEFKTLPTKDVFIDNFALFFLFNLVIWIKFLTKARVSYSTLTWWACSSIYLVLSFLSNRYWYTSNVLFFIFFASFLKDWLKDKDWKTLLVKLNTLIIICAVIFIVIFSLKFNIFSTFLKERTELNLHYEKVGLWMNKNIPPTETIYHGYWSDSPPFICLNPKNNYLVVLDPIYMFYRYPKEYIIYQNLVKGRVYNLKEAFVKVFKVNYGYLRNNNALYYQIKADSKNFKILYEDSWGIVFQVLTTNS